ncbi:enzymatic polyprotein [Plakobranchus ocellatus]|uniref:Enzymatic polyprotein n=1 Tax=Plakobranchus ocellatus TaxID=259542 RepID=A0AAV4C0D7_9GAST|nr:enzymatic polyprotein [Plakobranchus ocellatus]
MVARVQLQQMRQDRDEPIRAFAARLRGQAGVCNFSIKCPCGTYVDYSDVMVRDILIKGLSDEEIRLDILGEPFCCKTGWRITLVGSRFTSGAESRYAPIEGEALAVVDALDKARHFTLGCDDLIIAVDHKPLLKLFGDCCLDDIPNPRLRNLKEKSLRYRFRVVHIPGLHHAAADAISRKPVGNPTTLPLPDDVASIDPVPGDSQL